MSTGSPAYASPEQLQPPGLSTPAQRHLRVGSDAVRSGHRPSLPFGDAESRAAMVRVPSSRIPFPLPSEHRECECATLGGPDRHPGNRQGSRRSIRLHRRAHCRLAMPDSRAFPPSSRRQPCVDTPTVLWGVGNNPFKALRGVPRGRRGRLSGARPSGGPHGRASSGNPGPPGRLLAAVGPSGSGKVQRGARRADPGDPSGRDPRVIPVVRHHHGARGARPFEELESALLRVASHRARRARWWR